MRRHIIEIQNPGWDESQFWVVAARQLWDQCKVPNIEEEIQEWEIISHSEDSKYCGTQNIGIKRRGTHVLADGTEVPAGFAINLGGNLDLPEAKYEHKHLVYCSPNTTARNTAHGSYKFYTLDVIDKKCKFSYGRIGNNGWFSSQRQVADPPDSFMYWLRYYEKLKKGYVDVTDIYKKESVEQIDAFRIEHSAPNAESTKTDSEIALELFRLLSSNATAAANSALLCGAESVTTSMIYRSQELINDIDFLRCADLPEAEFIKMANSLLLELFCISPRSVSCVSDQLAYKVSDVDRILSRENALVDIMESFLLGLAGNRGGFASLGIEVRLATQDEIADIEKLMLDPYSGRDEGGYIPRVTRIWRIDNPKQSKTYASYLKSHNIKQQKQLFHGSSFGSWLSCIEGGLQLSYARVGMFGKAHYFANQFKKADGYVDGAWWGRGEHERRKFSYIGVYEVAYGKPLKVFNADSSLNVASLADKACNSVHAFKGSSLRNDEVMIYDDRACNIQYLIEYAS